jgi:hypothetical protein
MLFPAPAKKGYGSFWLYPHFMHILKLVREPHFALAIPH